MTNKNDLRKKAKHIRNSLDMKIISEKIVVNVSTLNEYKFAKHVMIFYPLGSEVDLRGLLKDKKQFYLPKVSGNELLVCPYKLGNELVVSKFKTLEPMSEPICDIGILDLVFIPALMADKRLNRLGYGGGFYDRFLSKVTSSTKKIVTIPKALIVDKIPADDFDELVDLIVCE